MIWEMFESCVDLGIDLTIGRKHENKRNLSKYEEDETRKWIDSLMKKKFQRDKLGTFNDK